MTEGTCGDHESSAYLSIVGAAYVKADHDTTRSLSEKLWLGAAETGESVTLGRIRKRKRWDSQRSFTPNNITLGAIGTTVKESNRGWDKSIE